MIAPLLSGACQVWWASSRGVTPQLLDLLDPPERVRHAGFVRAQDRALFLISHALTRIVAGHHAGLAPQAIRYAGGAGKPRFRDAASELEFSISHSGTRAVVALSWARAVGVDVERVSTAGPDGPLIRSVLSADEQRALMALPPARRQWAFCRYWTRKEAVLKATGDGLTVSPADLTVTAPTAAPAVVAWPGRRRDVHLEDLQTAAGYTASLAMLDDPLAVTHHDGAALLAVAT